MNAGYLRLSTPLPPFVDMCLPDTSQHPSSRVDVCYISFCVVLRQRRGFIRLALQYGVPIVPVFVFGEKYVSTYGH
eukprot:54915-Eustigmatos_ZCMA.PRE.1